MTGPARYRFRRRLAGLPYTRSIELAQGFARLAASLRVAGRFDHAEQALEIAFTMTPDHSQGDLYRRRAALRIYQDRKLEALRDAEMALNLTTGEEHTNTLITLAAVFYYSGRYQEAIDTYAEAIRALEPDVTYRYCNTLVSYASALAKGTDDDARKALEVCAEARVRLKERHRMGRAKLYWVEGLLHFRLGDHRQAWRTLDVARRSLQALNATPELAAIVADMARVSPEPHAVRHLCREAGQLIVPPHPLLDPLRLLTTARRIAIPKAAAALREAATVLAPCPNLG